MVLNTTHGCQTIKSGNTGEKNIVYMEGEAGAGSVKTEKENTWKV